MSKILEVEPNTIFIEPNFDLYINLFSNKIFGFLAEKYSKISKFIQLTNAEMDVVVILPRR